MPSIIPRSRPALKLVEPLSPQEVEWVWFCGRCAARAPAGAPPAPNSRVCPSCQFGLLLETRSDTIPTSKDAFLVIDAGLLVQGVSSEAETLLGVTESMAVNRPVHELVVPPDAEAQGPARFAAAVAEAMQTSDVVGTFVRPWNTFGVRMRAKIAPCGPPRAALLILETAPRALRAV
jgi:PAS domain-containing protein